MKLLNIITVLKFLGFGKFLFNQKKAIKRLNALLSKEELYNSVILTCTTEERKASIQLKLNTIKTEIEILKTRTNEDVSNLRGWRNKLLPPKELEEQINIVSAERMQICNKCPLHSKHHKSIRLDSHCTECGCTLSAKTKCLSCACPLNKWTAMLTEKKKNHGKKREKK